MGFPRQECWSCLFLLHVIFPSWGSNPCHLHWQADSLPEPPRKPNLYLEVLPEQLDSRAGANPPPWLASGYTAVHFLPVSRQSPDLFTRSSLGDNQCEYIKHIRGKNVTVKKRNPSKSEAKKRGAREANTGNTCWHWGVRVRVHQPRMREQVSPAFQKFTLYHFDFYRIPA
ncbi:unnamed protein product [Rangifer tarandus platyrhynchus]|uniref:Uncharacterized protein n=1 Tax=Rangifer tarandus platyrhynchus TaxID=3082113 RepID=A0ABN8Z5P3_RANTA|nr:unnamed protein product [Rangifer tarandus platyrhynchus]